MTRHLEGKSVLVTGAGRGLGRAEALYFARQGARLVLCDDGSDPEGRGADPAVIEDVVRDVRALGAEVVGDPRSVTEPGACDALVALAVERFGRLDAVVSSAGFVRERIVSKLEDDDLDALLAVYVRTAFGLTRAASRAMQDTGGGAILLTSSPSAFFGTLRQSALAAVHAAIVGLVRCAAVELKRHDIRVNALAPSARTRLTADSPAFQGIKEDSMSPEHVAPVAAFLISDLAKDCNGELIGVAGARVYAIRVRETTGAFSEGPPFAIEDVLAQWKAITRGA